MDKSLDEMINNLDPEERDILESYERGEWQPVENVHEEIRRYEAYARATLERESLISIALSTEDLREISQRADQAGLRSDEFIANIVHQFVSGELVERSTR